MPNNMCEICMKMYEMVTNDETPKKGNKDQKKIVNFFRDEIKIDAYFFLQCSTYLKSFFPFSISDSDKYGILLSHFAWEDDPKTGIWRITDI